MAGRPRMMARRVAALLERHVSIVEELQKMMPEQYLEAAEGESIGSLGRMWRAATDGLSGATDYIEDLSACLDFKADEADKLANATAALALPGDQGDDTEHSEVSDSEVAVSPGG